MIIVINMELALLTPPVGTESLHPRRRSPRRRWRMSFGGTTPFILLMLALLMLVTQVPEISLWLPKLLMG